MSLVLFWGCVSRDTEAHLGLVDARSVYSPSHDGMGSDDKQLGLSQMVSTLGCLRLTVPSPSRPDALVLPAALQVIEKS